MPQGEAIDLLRLGDAAFVLPKLGGMARPNGVVIVSERYWAFADTDGRVREGRMPRTPEALNRIPLARGLVRLAASLSPIFRRTGVAPRKERGLLVAALIAPAAFIAFPGAWGQVAGLAITVALLFMLLRGRALNLHGAEHRAIAAAEERRLTSTWEGSAKPSRFSPRCGTNFAALALPVTLVADTLWPLGTAVYTPLAVMAVSLALSMEVWRMVQKSSNRFWQSFLLPGLMLQRVTTREPRLDETRVALVAVASVLRRELSAS
jgi:uncharacterized protein YqhQ